MLCDICHKNTATIHLTEIVDNKIIELHICKVCAEKEALIIKEQLNIEQFLSEITKSEKINRIEKSLKCSFCGLSFLEFKKKGRFGCANCYEVFREEILPLIKKIQGSLVYKGKIPKLEKFLFYEEEKIKKRIEKAIKEENYEEAAKLRDYLKEIQSKKNNKNV